MAKYSIKGKQGVEGMYLLEKLKTLECVNRDGIHHSEINKLLGYSGNHVYRFLHKLGVPSSYVSPPKGVSGSALRVFNIKTWRESLKESE